MSDTILEQNLEQFPLPPESAIILSSSDNQHHPVMLTDHDVSNNEEDLVASATAMSAALQESIEEELSENTSKTVIHNDVSDEIHEILQGASCFGDSMISEGTLACAMKRQETEISDALDETVTRGILVKSKKDQACLYHFSSQETREALYQSIPDQDKAKRHATIARRLWKQDSFPEEVVVEQFLRGESCVDSKERYPVAALCLSAGKHAVKESRFDKAASYLNLGVRLLTNQRHKNRCWHDEYDLSLSVYQAAAEVNYCTADFDQAKEDIDAVLANAQSFEDTFGVYATYVYVLGARGKREEAINTGLEVLRRMGQPVPGHPKQLQIILGFHQTRRMLLNKSDEMILRLPLVEDDTAMGALRMLNLIFSHAFSARPRLVPMLVFRMTQLTLKHGLSVMSSVAFAKYGLILCSIGQFAEAERYAHLALTLYGRFPVQEWLPRVYTGVYGGVYSCVKPLETTLEPLRHAYGIGLLTGDIEFALIDAHIYSYNLFTLCRPLDFLESELHEFHKAAVTRKQEWIEMRQALFLQMIQNLRGKARGDPTRLIGETFDEETDHEKFNFDLMSRQLYHFYKLVLSYIFCDLEGARREADASRLDAPSSGHVGYLYSSLFDGMSALGVARQLRQGHGRRKAVRLARQKVRFLKKRALQNPTIVSGKLFLLKAELAWILRHHSEAWHYFTCAIAVSSHAGLLLDEALSNERAGKYFVEQGDKQKASDHFEQALNAYTKWGATAKADHLKNEMSTLM